ncbi:hypothetical protein R5R35_003822 [Gryllus longicercus]|uniref:Methionine--tRNA ligase, cytoplasmic n=1 Tax=Gryllus longicercus TaxID=2509291 RepID=A0AAN9VA74_9ORTH
MKLYTNQNNPAALKVLIAGNTSGKNVTHEIVAVSDAQHHCPRRLPVLLLDSGKKIFSTNASTRYLLPPSQGSEIPVDQWLEWEACQFLPVLAACLSSGPKLDGDLRNRFIELLQTLDVALLNKEYIVGNSISAADIVLFCSLYPLVADPRLRQYWLADRQNIVSWFLHLQALPTVKTALEALKVQPGGEAYQALIAGCWQPMPEVSLLTPADKQRPQLQSTGSLDEAPISEAELESAREAWVTGTSSRPRPKLIKKPIMPIAGEKNILITSALPYVNNVPHLGNIIGCVLSADVFARYCRLCNHNTLYICGTDEYGTATETKALEEGLTPQQICDKYFLIHDAVYKWFNISFDYFGRTTTPEQTRVCQEMFLEVHGNGFTSTQHMDQLLCQKCNRYLADRFVEGTCPLCGYEDARGDQCDGCGHLINAVELLSPRCKICRTTPIIQKSEQFFLDLPKVEPLIRHWIDKVWAGWSNNARVIARSWLKDGLKPRCITRDLKWGIPVPLKGYENKVFYVWFDAPIGYVSITAEYSKEWKRWWQPKSDTQVTLYQFIGKDNVPFHSIMFPATLLACNKGYTIVSYIMATEYLNYEDGKFSKSRGVGVFGTDAQNTGIPADIWRFYLLYVRPESQDSSFSWIDLATKNNSELLNNLGNFINRALTFAEKFFGGILQEIILGPAELALLAQVNREVRAYSAALERARLRDGIRHILSVSRHGNQFMQAQQPWVLMKGTDQERQQAGSIVSLCCNLACTLAVLLHPYMPSTSEEICEQLNAPKDVMALSPEVVQLLPTGHHIGKPKPLFAKIETAQIDKLKQQFSGRQKSASPEKSTPSTPSAYLEAAIHKQDVQIRQLKATGADQSEWLPLEATLQELKRQLAATQQPAANGPRVGNGPAAPAAAASPGNPEEIARLEAAVAQQGEKVRQLKGSGAERSVWQPQVAILQQLKEQLVAAGGSVAPPPKPKGKKK